MPSEVIGNSDNPNPASVLLYLYGLCLDMGEPFSGRHVPGAVNGLSGLVRHRVPVTTPEVERIFDSSRRVRPARRRAQSSPHEDLRPLL